ncbi:hypothetical protein ABPG74_000028 [Tetrahymena malaccensis]
MGACVSQFCQQQDQMILSVAVDSSKTPQQIYSQANLRQKDQTRSQKGDGLQQDNEDSDGEEMQLTQMIMELNGISQNIQNMINQRYNMEIQSISLIEQAQLSQISKPHDMDQEFSNNYFLSEQLLTSKTPPDEVYLHKKNSNGNFYGHMIQSFASGGIEGSPSSITQRQSLKLQNQQHQASALAKKQKSKKKRQFLVFRLPRTQFLLPQLKVIPSLNANEAQDIYYLKDLYDIQKIISSNLIINTNTKRRISASQFYQQNLQEKASNNNSSLFFRKLTIVMNEILLNDISFLSNLEQWSQIQKLSLHIQSSSNTDFLGMLIVRFRDIQELSFRIDTTFNITDDFQMAACQLMNLYKVKFVFNSLFFENNEQSKLFYERLFCSVIGKQLAERYYQQASATSLASIGMNIHQQQNQQQIPQFIQLESIKFSFIHTDCTPIFEALMNKVFKGITLAKLKKMAFKLHTSQDTANYQVQMLNYFLSSCSLSGNNSAINISKLKVINFGIHVSPSDHNTQENNTARFQLSTSNHYDDEIMGTKASTNMNQYASVQEISPKKLGQNKKFTTHDDTIQNFVNNHQITQSISAGNIQSHRLSQFGGEMQQSFSSFNPQMSFNLNNNNNNNGSVINPQMLGSQNELRSQLSKNYLNGFLKNFEVKKIRKFMMRDETGVNYFNSNLSIIKAAQNLVQVNLQFTLTQENQFQNLISLMQYNQGTIKKLQLEIEKKILISLYDDHKLFNIISKMQNLISFKVNYKTKEPIFNQVISAPNLIKFCEYKNVFNQSPVKQSIRQYVVGQGNQTSALFIKTIMQARNLLHMQSPDFTQLLSFLNPKANKDQVKDLLFQDIIIIKLIKQVKKRLAMCYISIHPSLKQFYKSNSLNNKVECSIDLQTTNITQNQFLLDLSQFY